MRRSRGSVRSIIAAPQLAARRFFARVSRLRATYTFTSRLSVRGIAQYDGDDRELSEC